MTLTLPNLRRDVAIAPFTTYQIGGPADLFVEVSDQFQLARAVRSARAADVPYLVLGTGANILVGDGGFRGLVILNRASLIRHRGHSLVAESGATFEALIASARARELSGVEHFVLIPSSVGGAVRYNLHFASVDALVWEISGALTSGPTLYAGDRVVSASVLDEHGSVHTLSHSELAFAYDDSILNHRDLILLEATFKLSPGNGDAIDRQLAANSAWRRAKQPQLEEFPSCGSIFKRIEGVGAGRLIEQSGLKGTTIGGVQVSPKHANYFVNLGGATAADVLELIDFVQARVEASTGYHLEPEVNVVGETVARS